MIKVLIIGLGKISLLHNIKKNKLSHNTHCGYLYSKKNFKIVGVVEKKLKLIKIFNDFFSCESFNSIKEAIKKTEPNLVIIATPTNTHLKVFKEVIFNKTNNTQAVLFEKPVGKNLKEIKNINEIIKKKRVKIFVNYNRDYEEAFIKLNSYFLGISNCNAEVSYNGGFINNASHFISLFVNFFGKVKKIEVLKKKKIKDDFFINCILYFKNCVLNLKINKIKHNHYFKIKYNNKNLLLYSNKSKYVHFSKMNSYKKIIYALKNDHSNIYKQIENFFNKKNYFNCSLNKAIYVHQIINKCINYKIQGSK
jgi:predicted dehydrogenase